MQANKGINYTFWYRLGLFNLLIVALIGALIRYKMVASLPWLNHKFWLHGHSHFAFNGWITLVLMTASISIVTKSNLSAKSARIFRWLLMGQAISAYGMLLSFPVQGYAPLSIFFSSSSIFVAYCFCYQLAKHLTTSTLHTSVVLAIRAAMVFLILSSLCTFSLALLMVSQSGNQPMYFSALYFFLHFQYNGWFLFAIAAILIHQALQMGVAIPPQLYHAIKWLAIACLPAVLLSLLWMKLPALVYWIATLAAIAQVIPIFIYYKSIFRFFHQVIAALTGSSKILWITAFIALVLKLLLQLFSTLPWLSKYAFAYRPVVIAYLHLILLGFVTCFLLGYLFNLSTFSAASSSARNGVRLFLTGFILTEASLFLQGLGYIGWVNIPFIQPSLLVAALLMAIGFSWINASIFFRKQNNFLIPKGQ